MEFVIIGGDAAGMSAASRAKRKKPDMKVTVLEKTQDVSYSACGLPYNIAEPERDIEDLVVRQADIFREKQGINLLTGHTARQIDPKRQTVSGDGFEVSYDKLLIATGCAPVIPSKPGFDLPGVMVLKSLEDGRRIKAYLKEQRVRKAVILGMGYIALEMVEALRGLDIDVEMLKPRPTFLPWLAAPLAEAVKAEVEKNGVKLHLGLDVKQIEQENGRLKVVCADAVFSADLVLVAVGVRPNSRLAADAGLVLGPGDAVSVDRRMQTSDENVFAAGDCADAHHVVSGQKVWVPLALRANRSGWAVADNVCGGHVELPGIVGTAVFKVFNYEVARTGLTAAEAQKAGFDPVAVDIKSRSRAHAHPGNTTIRVHMLADRGSGRLLGAQMVGPEGAAHRINAPAVALHAKMTVDQYGQSDLGYAPPFGPTWDPTLVAANQLLKAL